MFQSSRSTISIPNVENFDVYAKSWSLEVKVPIIFSGTAGFPPPMEGR